ncbi:MAG: DNA-binding transcriptional LysR family regulator [Oleiphilaceae bacterium]|jgi:DNA-binding transcriptional LysR family regulator
MKYTLRHLQIFLAVAKDESISSAADALSMSPSATSAALQEFESRYDMKLFDRSAKRLQLNSYGRELRAKAQGLLAHAQAFDQELQLRPELKELNVGASYTIGNYLAMKYLAAYLENFPDRKVDISVGNTPQIVSKVLNFEVDIGLIEAEINHSDLDIQPWQEDRMSLFCLPEHPLAGKTKLSDKDLLSCKWILREEKSGHRQTFDRSMQGLLPDLNITLVLGHNEAIKNAVKAGLGVGCLSELAVADEIERGLLVPLVSKRSMMRSFYFVRHKQAPTNQAVDQWITLCRDLPL